MKRASPLSFLFLLAASICLAGPDPRGILELEGYSNGAATGITSKRGRNDFTIKERVASGDELFFIDAYGYNGTSFGNTPAASISIKASENWSTTANGTSIVFETTQLGETTPSTTFSITGSGLSSNHTTRDTAAAAAGSLVEIDGSRFDDAYVGSAGANDVLYSGWRFESTYDISGVSAPDTLHGLTIFAEMNSARNNQYFSAGLEASNKCFAGSLSPSNAACVGSIDHVKVFNDQNIAFAFPAIGNNARVDIFNTGFESVDFSTNGLVYVYRPEIYGGKAGLRFNMWATDTDAQILNGGNILKLPVRAVLSHGGTIDVSKSCGGSLVLTSTGPITTSLSATFTAPSNSETNGTFNDGCKVTVSNGNLVAANTITLDFNATNFFSSDGQDVILPALGGSLDIVSYPTASVWFQTTETTKKKLTGTASLDFGATAAGACESGTITVSGAVDGDPVMLGIPNALAASDSYQHFWGYVSGTNTVTVRRCNPTNATTALSNPSAATVRATVMKP